jgi:hypothetical protein
MTSLLDRAMDVARSISQEMQDEIARLAPTVAGSEQAPVALTAEGREAIAESRAAASRGEFPADGEARAAWAKRDR